MATLLRRRARSSAEGPGGLVLVEGRQDEGLERRRDVRAKGSERRGLFFDLHRDQREGVRRRGDKRKAPGEHLVEDRADAPDVGLGSIGPATEPLGSHVGRGPEQRPVDGELLLEGGRTGDLGDSEIEDFRRLLTARRAVEEDVRRLDVAVDDPRVVSGGKGEAHRLEDLGAALRGEAALLLELCVQRDALEQLHDEERDAARVDAEIEHLNGVRVLDPAGRSTLPAEPFERLRIGVGARAQDLDRHGTIELLVMRPEHDAEAAASDPRLEPVPPSEDAPRAGLCRRMGLGVGDRGCGPRCLPGAKMGLDASPGHGVVDGLGHVVVGPEAQRLDDILAVRLGCDHDDRQHCCRPRLADLAQHLDSVHPRHHDVEEDEVHCVPFQHLERLGPVGRGEDIEPRFLEAFLHQLDVGWQVVDDEDRGAPFAHGRDPGCGPGPAAR